MTCYGQEEVAMRGPELKITWQEDEATLYRLYRSESEAELRMRRQALWLLRQGYRAREVAGLVGIHLRTLRRWVAWYRQEGLAGLRGHRTGNPRGRAAHLTPAQESALVAEAAAGRIPSVAAAWVAEHYVVRYTYWGMRSVFLRQCPAPWPRRPRRRSRRRGKKGPCQRIDKGWRDPADAPRFC